MKCLKKQRLELELIFLIHQPAVVNNINVGVAEPGLRGPRVLVPRLVQALSPRQCSMLLYDIVQCSTVQYSTVQYSTVQFSAVQYSIARYRTTV